jgi:hypothetical protein
MFCFLMNRLHGGFSLISLSGIHLVKLSTSITESAKALGGFLQLIVCDSGRDQMVGIFAGKFLTISAGFQMWCTILVSFQADGGHADELQAGRPQ